MKLEGLLVDLVPFDAEFQKLEYTWRNSEAQFWAAGGAREFASRQQVEQMMARMFGGENRGPSSGVWCGIQTKDGVKIGGIGAPWVSVTHRWGMLGAKIGDPAYWGGGYGTDALLLLIDYCFDWLDFRRLWLTTSGFNVRVQRQMAKVGFVLEGRYRTVDFADGAWYDALVYGLLREEWPGRAALIEKLGLKAKTE